MTNQGTVGPVGEEFESLVNLLPPWALTYEQMTIQTVRQALRDYDQKGSKEKMAENLHATKTVV